MRVPDDPYFAGHIEKSIKPPVEPPPVVAWRCVYVANLIFPLLMGWMATREGGGIGMFIGIVAVFALGHRLCFIARRAMLAVVYGGWVVALFQLAPILHIFAGIVGVWVAHGFEDVTKRDQVNTVLGGFLATIVTGGILIVVATALGLVIQWIMSRYWGGKTVSANVLAKEIQVIGR